MLALLAPFLPYILAALGIIGGAFGIAWGRKTTQTAAAQADAAKAQAGQQVAVQQTAEAQANADAQKAAGDAAAERTAIDNAVAAKPADEVRNELSNWTRP
ncbi:hypothetical protein [Paraburkholderia sp. BL21I4N1]|uniref:hypothetical protein n=1 Tax=Paraburkholderia sp. BL21I4N1 TaxID=1938801 RepID=UPI000CFC4305|nr:hypothetical protein [Paraburkholderia sp. BL21I4N1]PQV51875.1 hypothetical protein B0G83_10484 [Paraburkholderia sp. BL21I4N1]